MSAIKPIQLKETSIIDETELKREVDRFSNVIVSIEAKIIQKSAKNLTEALALFGIKITQTKAKEMMKGNYVMDDKDKEMMSASKSSARKSKGGEDLPEGLTPGKFESLVESVDKWNTMSEEEKKKKKINAKTGKIINFLKKDGKTMAAQYKGYDVISIFITPSGEKELLKWVVEKFEGKVPKAKGKAKKIEVDEEDEEEDMDAVVDNEEEEEEEEEEDMTPYEEIKVNLAHVKKLRSLIKDGKAVDGLTLEVIPYSDLPRGCHVPLNNKGKKKAFFFNLNKTDKLPANALRVKALWTKAAPKKK